MAAMADRASRTACPALVTVFSMKNVPTNSEIQPTSSGDLAIWPFLRASRFFFGVGASVLSSPWAIGSALQDLHAVGHPGREQRGDGVRQQRDHDAAEHEADEDLEGHAELEDVHLGRRFGEKAESDVGE